MRKYYYCATIGYNEAGYERIIVVIAYSLKNLKNKGYNSKLNWIRFCNWDAVKEYYSSGFIVVSENDATM